MCAAAVVVILGMSAAELIALVGSCAAPLDGVKVGVAGGLGTLLLVCGAARVADWRDWDSDVWERLGWLDWRGKIKYRVLLAIAVASAAFGAIAGAV